MTPKPAQEEFNRLDTKIEEQIEKVKELVDIEIRLLDLDARGITEGYADAPELGEHVVRSKVKLAELVLEQDALKEHV